jgi:Rnl2 family RNA ligase
MFMKYPELVRVDRRPEILAVKEVVATEKIHGTNFRVFFPAGMTSVSEVRFGGRNEEHGTASETTTSFYGGRPMRWFTEDLLGRMMQTFASRGFSDVTVFGEAFGAGIQRGVRYTPGDEVLFRAFDMAVGENLVTYDLFAQIADEAGLPRVPEIWRGEPSVAAFDALLEKPSTEAVNNGVTAEDNLAEGVVIRSTPLLRDVFGQWLIVKHKSEKFSEVAKRDPGGKPRADVSAATDFALTFVTPGRITNALGRLRDAGKAVTDDMQDMKELVPAMMADLQKECMPEWNEVLALGMTDKQVRGEVTKTLGIVYRRMLLDRVAR